MSKRRITRSTLLFSTLLLLGSQNFRIDAQETGGIFASGMETTGFADWSSIQNQTGYMGGSATQINRVSTQFAHGSYGMQFVSNLGTSQDNRAGLQEVFSSPAAGTTLNFRCYMYLPAGAMKPNSQLTPIVLFSGSTAGLWLQFNTDGSGGISSARLQGIDGVGGSNFIPGVPVSLPTNTWNLIEFSLHVGTTKTNGSGQIWVNGASVGSNFSIDTTAATTINNLIFGNGAYGGGPKAGLSIYYDDFKMANAGPIGAYATSTPVGYSSVSVTPANLVFPLQNTGSASAVQNVSIQNTGSSAVVINSFALTGSNPGDYAVSSNTCTATLAAGKSCAVSITFNPTATGSRAAYLTITDSTKGGPQNVTLSGSAQTTTTTYYIDNVNGSDSNNGTSPATAISTIAKLNSLTLIPGQTVALKSGDEWHEAINVQQSGSSSASIRYTAYGSGPAPIISAADILAGGWMQGPGTLRQELCLSPCIFSSGFEVSNFSDWTSTSVGDSNTTMDISSTLANQGASSMILTTNSLGSRSATYAAKAISALTSGSSIGVRFYINAASGAFKPSSSLILALWERNGSEIANISFTTDINGNPRYINSYNEAGIANLIPYNTPVTGYVVGSWNEIEIDYSTIGPSGSGHVYINGALLGTNFGVNMTALLGVNEARIGNFGALAPTSSMNLDNFRIESSSLPMGLFSGGIPTTVWYHPQTTDPKLINFGGQAGTPVSSITGITAPNQFYWDGLNLYVYSLIDPGNAVEVPQRPYALVSTGASNITISGIEFRGAQMHNVYCGAALPCTNWHFDKDTFNSSYTNGLFFQFNNGVSGAGLTVTNSVFKGSGGSGLALANGGLLNAIITNNQFYDLCKLFVANSSANTTCAAVYGFSQTGIDGGVYVAYNNISNIGLSQTAVYGSGIHADTVTGWDIEHNTVQNTNMAGVEIEKGQGSIARYNLAVNTAHSQYFGGIFVRAGDGLSATNHVIEFNTSYGGYWACLVGISQNAGLVTMTNLTFRKNICVASTSGVEFYLDPGANNNGNTYTSNNFGQAAGNFISFLGNRVGSYPAFDQILGYASGNLQGDPQFVSPLTGVFALLPMSPATGIGAIQ